MNAERRKKLFRPADAVLISVVLLTAAVLFWRFSTREAGSTAVIEQNGRVLYTVSLAGEGSVHYHIGGEYPLTVECENGEIWFTEATCPDKVCMRSGKLSRAGETAACLPAGVVIRITGEAPDAVTG